MPQTIRYGVEIECSIPNFGSDPRSRIAADLRALGVNATATGYSGRDYTMWQVKSDCSLSPSSGHQGTAELVSPILTWGDDDSEAQLRTASEYLVTIGAKVNNSCGGHVHIGVSHLDASGLANLIESYHYNQNAIDGLIAPARRGNGRSYCYRQSDSRMAATVQDIRTGGTTYVTYAGSHGNQINADWYSQRGTLEFRQRQSSINHYKILGWVGFLVGLVHAAEAGVALRDDTASTEDLLLTMVEGEYLSPVLRDWVLGTVPRVNTIESLAANITAARTAATSRVSRLMRLQGVTVYRSIAT